MGNVNKYPTEFFYPTVITVCMKFGERGFCYSDPAAWISLPSELHDISDTNTFKKRLQSVLSDCAYQ